MIAYRHLNPGCKHHVLVVEDDLLIRKFMHRILNSIDPQISYTWVTTAEEAGEILNELKVSLVISDFNLRGRRTGMQLWKNLKETAATSNTPFMMISGLGVERCFTDFSPDLRRPVFIPKPLDPERTRLEMVRLLQTGSQSLFAR